MNKLIKISLLILCFMFSYLAVKAKTIKPENKNNIEQKIEKFGQGAKEFGPAGIERELDRMMKELEITPEQKKEIVLIIKKYEPKLKAIKEETEDNRKNIMELLNTDEPNKKEILKIHDELSESKGEMLLVIADMHKEIRIVLTPEQKIKLKELLNKKSEKMQKMHEKMNKNLEKWIEKNSK